jgi:hypothetical protein
MPRQPLTMQVETSLAVLLSGRLGLLETPHPASPAWPADAVPWADLVTWHCSRVMTEVGFAVGSCCPDHPHLHE